MQQVEKERGSKKSCGKLCELKLLNDSLMKENVSKDREIRQLNKDVQQYEQTILNLRKEISMTKYHTPDVSTRDAEVMAGMCWAGTECGDWEPVKDFTEMLRVETQQFQDRIQKMEANLKSSSDSVRALRKVNVSLTEEMHAMRRVCAALVEESRAATVRAQFKDDIIREMRRQLKQAKAKLKEVTEATATKSKDFVSGDGECPRGSSVSYDSVTIACVRAQPRRKRDVPLRDSLHRDNSSRGNIERDRITNAISDGVACETAKVVDRGQGANESGDEFLVSEEISHGFSRKYQRQNTSVFCCHNATSTPDASKKCLDTSPDVSIIERPPSPPILVSDISIEDKSEITKRPLQKSLIPNSPSPCNSGRTPEISPGRKSPRKCPSPLSLGRKSPPKYSSLRSRVCPSPSTSKACQSPSNLKTCPSSSCSIACGARDLKPKRSGDSSLDSPRSPKSCSPLRTPKISCGVPAAPRSRSPVLSPKISLGSPRTPQSCSTKSSPKRSLKSPCKLTSCSSISSPSLSSASHSPQSRSDSHSPRFRPGPKSPTVSARPQSPISGACYQYHRYPSSAKRPCITSTVGPKSPELQHSSESSSRGCCLKLGNDSPKFKSVKIQVPVRKDKCEECVEELFFNAMARKSNGSNSGAPCSEEDCKLPPEVKHAPRNTEKIKKEYVNRSCSAICKDSGGASSLVDSATGSCDATARANYYHNKLRSTLQILQNKEETIRVQAESLSVAEGRISTLTERAAELRQELERKSKELQALRKTLECCRVEKVDVSISADSEMENQSDIVNTLQNNLSVIEELYRECFYETAKQEGLIDMLRKSYLDVRLMDKQKADQIGRMQTVINTQKWSLDRCQDIALEVDNLKMEISNFLSSSNTSTNNDSGMWERSEESFASLPGVQEELQDVMEQLLRLREILTLGCTCGLEEENIRLKRENDALQKRIAELCGVKCELEQTVAMRESQDKRYKEEIECREQQLTSMRQEKIELLEEIREKRVASEQLAKQLRQSQVLLHDKNRELDQLKEQYDSQRATIDQLRQELKKADTMCKENCKIRSEVSYLSAQVDQWRSQLMESECRVRNLDAKLRQAQACYREKENNVSELQAQLEQAHARGAELCVDARRALGGVRHWAKRMRDRHRESEEIIKQKDAYIASLQRRLEEHHCNTTVCTSTSDADHPCSKCSSASRLPSHRVQLEPRRSQCFDPCPSEVASCSSAPTPPKRLFRKKPACGDKRCQQTPWACEASSQHPTRRDACQTAKLPFLSYCTCPDTTPRDVSPPADELFTRVEQLSKALADGYRRWTRADPR